MKSVLISLKAQDGTKLSWNLRLTHALKASDPAVAATWASVSGGSSLPCTADLSRDAVFIGSATVTNDTQGFSADLGLPMGTVADGNLNLGVADPGQGASCASLVSGPGSTDAGLSPDLSQDSWGPVGLEFVLHNYYSPGVPSGDASALAHANVEVIPKSQHGLLTVTSSSPIFAVNDNGVSGILKLTKLNSSSASSNTPPSSTSSESSTALTIAPPLTQIQCSRYPASSTGSLASDITPIETHLHGLGYESVQARVHGSEIQVVVGGSARIDLIEVCRSDLPVPLSTDEAIQVPG